MHFLDTYLNKLSARGNVKLAESIKSTADDVGNTHLQNFSFISHDIGLLFGNVQSGKTGQMFGIICKAAELGFYAFVILTTDNVVLQQQTLERVKSDLEGFVVCGENDARLFIDNCLQSPVIVVLKKNVRILKLWANIFNSTGFMRGNPLFIIDDEADATSLNTMVNKDRQSSINKYLDIIKNGSASSIFLQVTGTPQAIYLQTKASGWHPSFTYYFKPGDGYLGGDFFFPQIDKPMCIKYIDDNEHPTKSVVIRHLLVSAQILATGGLVSNCLVHPSVRVAVHKQFADDIKSELLWCSEHVNETAFISLLKSEYDNELTPKKTEKVSFNTIYEKIVQLLSENKIKVIILNGKTDVESVEYSEGCNFIVGGNTLGRGVTFPSLQTIYYTRTSKQPQADTMWQHSRMFGYDRDAGMMRVYIDEHLYKLFADINATNNSIIAQIEKGIKDVKIYYPDGLRPTRKNVLDEDHVEIISGGTNYYPFYPDNNTIADITTLLKPFSENEPYYQVSLRLLKEILSHIIPSPDFKLDAFQSVLTTMLSERPAVQAILIVRRNRDVRQGSGALLSSNDWELGGTFNNSVVLTMYQVTGNKGWDGKQLWVPNIKLPSNTVYYDVNE